MLRLACALLVLALVGAGCVGANVEPSTDAPLAAAAAPPLLSASFEWDDGGSGSFPIGEAVALDGQADALLVDFEATMEGAVPMLQVRALAPDGTEHLVGGVQGIRLGAPSARAVAGWVLLDAQPGEWSFRGVSDTPTQGVLTVTAVEKAARPQPVAGTGEERVVVAVVDTGVNPYHDVFQRPALSTSALPARIVDAKTGAPPLSVPLQRGEDYFASLRADAGLWAAMPGETLVHFEGTNLLGYRVGETELPAVPVLDRRGHGTAVSHAVTRENPDVLVVLVTARSYDDAVLWAASQPWVDLLSLSWGPPVNAVGPAYETTGIMATPAATRAAADAGKVVFGASGNDPTPTFSDTTSGPIWVHAVSGSEAAAGGRAFMSGNFVDTVANWTQTLATHVSLEGEEETSGTSFATPTTAGVASRILHETRLRAGHVGGIVEGALVKTDALTLAPKDLRDALNATASYWDTAGYAGPDAVPVAPTPWVSMGWGHVDGSLVPAAVDLLLGLAPAPEKPAAAHAWMQAHHDLREHSWGG